MIDGFKGRFKGQTVYVFGSGASLDLFDRSFFDDKICVATNRTGIRYGLKNYYICSHNHLAHEYSRLHHVTAPIICPDRDCDRLHSDPLPDESNVFRFRASRQWRAAFNVEKHWPANDTLLVGSAGVHTSMHFAQWAGASTIILVGADNGVLDDKTNFDEYMKPPYMKPENARGTDRSWVAWEKHTRDVANKIRSLGCQVYSLSPFINWNLEGHKYRSVVDIN
jgi:hypothetical protein